MQTTTTLKSNGFILHETAHIVSIITLRTRNQKTGPMAQIWFLVKSENPIAAVKSGADRRICGSCPLRGNRGENRACYVKLSQAPLSIWKKWARGGYPQIPSLDILRGRKIRFGAYGDPTLLPFALASQLASISLGWAGYTHQWRKPLNQAWKTLVMASVESAADEFLARSLGWRTFRVTSQPTPNSIECPSEKGIQCADCLLCSGTNRQNAPSVWIAPHGSGKKFVNN